MISSQIRFDRSFSFGCPCRCPRTTGCSAGRGQPARGERFRLFRGSNRPIRGLPFDDGIIFRNDFPDIGKSERALPLCAEDDVVSYDHFPVLFARSLFGTRIDGDGARHVSARSASDKDVAQDLDIFRRCPLAPIFLRSDDDRRQVNVLEDAVSTERAK